MTRPDRTDPKPRPQRRLFTDLARWMVGLGLLAGIAFPFLATLLGLPPEEVYTPRFFGATLLAGLAVGLANYGLARGVVRPRLRLLAGGMHQVAESIGSATYSDDWSRCRPETCSVPVDSQDELGESAAAFNRLVEALMNAHEVENAVRDFSRELSGQLELAPLAARALTQLLNHTGAQAGAVLVEQGGEEFLVLLPGAGCVDARQVAERIRHTCAETPVHDGEQTIQVTVSAGYTAFPEQDAGDEDALIRSADTALYAAKAGGRNRVAAGECPAIPAP